MPQPFGMLKQGKITFGLGLKQHSVPKNCLQGEQESRYYDYPTDDYQTNDYQTESLKHCLELVSMLAICTIEMSFF